MSTAKKWVIGIGAAVLMVAIPLGIYFLVYATAEGRGRIALHNQQRSATAIQASYEFFHDTCRAVIAQSQQLTTLETTLATVKAETGADPFGQRSSQIVQLQTQVAGLSNLRDSSAQDYNAKSHEFTHNFMRSGDLPDEIGPPDGVSYDALRCENQRG